MDTEQLYRLETALWEAAKERNSKAYLELVCEDAVMVCGGFRCSGREYSEIISQFDCKSYEIQNFEMVSCDNNTAQSHYVITVEVSDERNADLAGTFHVTTTWKKVNDSWKAVFNMDHKVE